MRESSSRREVSIDWVERVALAGSFVCLLHCLALPLLLTALPALSATLGAPESFHVWVLLLALPAAAFALLAGRARHSAGVPVLVGFAGILLLLAGVLWPTEGRVETALTVAGSLLLGAAHVANWRLRNICTCAVG